MLYTSGSREGKPGRDLGIKKLETLGNSPLDAHLQDIQQHKNIKKKVQVVGGPLLEEVPPLGT